MDLIRITKDICISEDKNFAVGKYALYNNTKYPKLYYLTDIAKNKDGNPFGFRCKLVDMTTLQLSDEETTLGNDSLNEYYTVVILPIDTIKDCAERLIRGESIDDMSSSSDASTALVDMKSKDTLVRIKEETEKAVAVANQIQAYAQSLIEVQKAQLDKIVSVFNDKICKMRSEVSNLEYVIQTIELYAGIEEEVIQIHSGESAPIDAPLVLHQAVLYMDEELALIDDEFDYHKIGFFNEWLVKDGNYKKVLPEERCIIACKPRRTDKKYNDDAFCNWLFNKPNHRTMFLIRNGENIYKIESDNISLDDRMFPNTNELEGILNSKTEYFKEKQLETFRKRYTKVIFLIQGLIDRSSTLSPHNIKAVLTKDIDITKSDGIELRYELDMEKALSDGHLPYNEWLRQLNSKLTTGKRIILTNYDFDNVDFIRYYSNKWSEPNYPSWGVYVLEDNPNYDSEDQYYRHNKRHIIRYMPRDAYRERKNRESIQIGVDREGIFNYDDVKLEDIDYYLNSRLHRSKYYEFVKVLKIARKLYLEEKHNEDEFIKMIVGRLQNEVGLTPKDGFSYEGIVKVAIDEFKDSLKWKRSILDKDKETYYMVQRKVLSKNYRDKYFK